MFAKFTEETSERTIKALIGITKPQFFKLCLSFATAHQSYQHERVQNGELKRLPKGGHRGQLNTTEKKLFFLLYYLKTYCTFDVLGFHFGFSAGHAHQHVEQLMPVLQRALEQLQQLPAGPPSTPAEFKQLLEQYAMVAIDGVECACVRPQDEAQQKARYSGKKNGIR